MGSVLCLETCGTNYSVTCCHITEERIPYQYLRHFKPVQNLTTPLLQMQAQRDERSIIHKFLITFTALASHQKHKMCVSQGGYVPYIY